MNLKDVLIMEVPSAALKNVVKSRQIEARLSSNEEMAAAIAEKDSGFANELADEFKFAGSTAVNLNILMSGISPEWHDKEFFKRKLREKFSEAIFTSGIRPNLEVIPKLIRAYEHEEKLVLAFSFLGPARRYLDDFEIVSRRPQIVEYVVIHFSPFAIEVRANHEQNIMFRDSVLSIMGIQHEVVWEKATKLSEEQANELARNLKARLRAAKHKMIEGPYATKEVTANTQVEDLENDEAYKKEFNNQPMKKKTLVFDYDYSFGYSDTISYVITDEGLWIRSKAGEEVISHILNHIIKIRYPSDMSEEELDENEFEQAQLEEEHIKEQHIEEQIAIELK
jgi:hypothetical protein